MHNLAKNFSLEEGSSTILFEPSEMVPFNVAWGWQKEWQEKLLKDPNANQGVWMLQHNDCYTLGRGASDKNLLFDLNNPPCDVYRIDRGGEVTCHLPGQLVVYLVLNLRRYKTDLHWYLRMLENVLLEVLEGVGLNGYLVNGVTGVWCNGKKVASIGVGSRRWITQHGIAINVDCDLSRFEKIIPCGLNDSETGTLCGFMQGLKIADIQQLMKKSLEKHFRLLWID